MNRATKRLGPIIAALIGILILLRVMTAFLEPLFPLVIVAGALFLIYKIVARDRFD